MRRYPFSAVVGADDLALALVLTSISPEVGGVLIRGEKGTAKSTIVRGLAEVLPPIPVVEGCRFSCDPAHPDANCPDGPHEVDTEPPTTRATSLVELPVGASEDRVIGSLDLSKALGAGQAVFQPGLLAAANRGLLYVDEVNLLHDHLVDVLLDAAAMGVNSVERDGVSVTHAARIVLIGTMNPEEGELRPQLLDRFGLTVEVAASRDPQQRAEIVRRRLAYDSDPDGFAARFDPADRAITDQLVAARRLLPEVRLTDQVLTAIARVCAGFDVDGMRADLVTARAASAHAAWCGRTTITRADIRQAALFALPHRRRRDPFDAPGLDEELLDRLLDESPLEPDPEPDPTPPPGQGDDSADPAEPPTAPPPSGGAPEAPDSDGSASEATPPPSDGSAPQSDDAADEVPAPAPSGVAGSGAAYRTRRLALRGLGSGASGKRSRAITDHGRVVGSQAYAGGRPHLVATLQAAAPHQSGRPGDTVRIRAADLRGTVTEGRESNLVLFVVDASGSMAARRRMSEVKTAVLSLLLDAYQRRDRVGLITFRGREAELVLPPTSSVDAAARCLDDLSHGGRTPLAEGLFAAAHTLQVERVRDPRSRPLVVVITDGRATSGPDALARAHRAADHWHRTGAQAIVIDCETGRFRLGLAGVLATRMGAEHLALGELAAGDIVNAVTDARADRPGRSGSPAHSGESNRPGKPTHPGKAA